MLAMLFVPIAALVGISWWLSTREAIKARDVIASVVLAAWVAVVGTKVYIDRVPAASAESEGVPSAFRVPEWAVVPSTEPPAAPVDPTAENSATTAAPVAELIGGLEARLANDPNDAKGWALLAQSYAFVGDAAAAEHALQRAVALGADEQALRERVQAARRGPDTQSWIDRTIGG
jgi:cytochrome c-type biogenesis protein CcmH/NrfG